MMDESHGWRLQLAFAGIHPDTASALLDAHGPEGAVAAVARTSRSDRAQREVLVPATQRVEQLMAAGFSVEFRGAAGYPPALGALPNAPDVLFVHGTDLATHSDRAVAVVGTRRCSPYGRNLAEAYGRAIAEAGWLLVSGLARGIDGAAHRGTVAGAGPGIAILGCGLDVDYPREHRSLADRLIDGGGSIVSEYPPGTPPEGWRFPPRNRIISGLSKAVVVVEAAVKGGALITAGIALDQGISVFATPGDVDRESAAGCNLLIRDGAHPVLDPADLIAELELILGPAQNVPIHQEKWAWNGVSADDLAGRRGLSIDQAGAQLGKAEAAGDLVRYGDRFYPRP